MKRKYTIYNHQEIQQQINLLYQKRDLDNQEMLAIEYEMERIHGCDVPGGYYDRLSKRLEEIESSMQAINCFVGALQQALWRIAADPNAEVEV